MFFNFCLKWEHEKWKFEKDCQVKFYSLASGKALRGKANGSVDALGGDMDMSGTSLLYYNLLSMAQFPFSIG